MLGEKVGEPLRACRVSCAEDWRQVRQDEGARSAHKDDCARDSSCAIDVFVATEFKASFLLMSSYRFTANPNRTSFFHIHVS